MRTTANGAILERAALMAIAAEIAGHVLTAGALVRVTVNQTIRKIVVIVVQELVEAIVSGDCVQATRKRTVRHARPAQNAAGGIAAMAYAAPQSAQQIALLSTIVTVATTTVATDGGYVI